MDLRPYQSDLIKNINDSEEHKHYKIGVTSPTGTGKTFTIQEFLRPKLSEGKRAVFVAPQTNLVDQTIESFQSLGHIERLHGKKYSRSSNMYVTTWQTLRNRKDLGSIDYIVFDEYHIGSKGKSFAMIQDSYPEATIIGLSATMYDADGKSFSDSFDVMVESKGTKWFVDNGYLSPVMIYSPIVPDLKGVRTVGKDYNKGDLDKVMSESSLILDIANKCKKYAKNRRTFVYGVTISHADLLAEEFRSIGIRAESYHSNSEDRPQLLKDFKEGKIDMLCSVNSLLAGVDAPFVDCLIIARPTKSHSLFRQVVGRGMRTFEGKEKCIVIDCGGITRRLGHPYDKPVPKESIEKHSGLSCPSCQSPIVKLLSTKALSSGREAQERDQEFEVVKTYQCRPCGEIFRRVIESEVSACDECDSIVFKSDTRIEEYDEALHMISVCPHCGHEKKYRTVPLVDVELGLVGTKSDFNMYAQTIATTMSNYLSSSDTSKLVELLSRLLKITNNQLQFDILDKIDRKLNKKIVMTDICKIVEEMSFRHLDCVLLDFGTLKHTFDCSNDLDKIILVANELYFRLRPGFQMKKNRMKETLDRYDRCTIERQRLTKSVRTKINNMYDRGHRMSSLIYFADWLENQI